MKIEKNKNSQIGSGANLEATAVLPAAPRRRQRADGAESREAILMAAAKLATTRGLHGLSLGDLAAYIGMSKSGLFAHFGSKDELELATIEKAAEIFDRDVSIRGNAAPPGLSRIRVLCDSFMAHVESRIFPGGCFFTAVAAELESHPGRARDRVIALIAAWHGVFNQGFREAQQLGEIGKDIEPEQLTFETLGMLAMANRGFAMTGDAALLGRGKQAIERIIESVRTKKKR